jgi:XTP/dITP diphosphohydrolase
MLVGSYDVPGSRLLDLVAVMDRLRSPGGCPWDAQQTHESLVPYLLEEAHEAVEAIESGDRAHMAEELGDLLLQVVFHARVAQEHPDAPFGIDDVAGGIVEKLVRRHPHVFADVDADTAAEVSANWEQIKAEEKSGRTSVLDGIPAGLPALARADKAGARLMALVLEARGRGEDPEAALRAVVRALEQAAAGAGR